jgi:tetratricopeptide (TPR) repeat protein
MQGRQLKFVDAIKVQRYRSLQSTRCFLNCLSQVHLNNHSFLSATSILVTGPVVTGPVTTGFSSSRPSSSLSTLILFALAIFAGLVSGEVSLGSEIDDARKFFRTGDYQSCEKLARTQVERGVWNEFWPRTLIETLLMIGKYDEAVTVFEKATERFRDNIRLRLIGVQCYRYTNADSKADQQLEFIDSILVKTQLRFISTKDLVPLGEFFLQRGEDPKEVLRICFDQAIKNEPKSVDAYLATARMALSKSDSKVASQALSKAAQLDESDPEIFYLLSKAWQNSDPEKATDYLKQSLDINENYIPSLLLLAESKMSNEDYSSAEQVLNQIEMVNPKLPKLWALRAAIAHLQGRYEEEGSFRRKGLEPWSLNPEVDYTIGTQLSNHYRFAESVAYQRRALVMDEKFIPAASQLSQDILRLGNTDEGWKLVDEARTKDPYNVTVFNLKQLQSQLEKFTIIEVPGFVIRMDPREEKIYGKDVVNILSEARAVLTKKYEVELEEPIFVEIFPKQKEFAIRTLGLPGGQGLLGVCFGRLITANSPAALSVDYNWKAVLWHEYCHVVTLQKTKNKMPRWLSEGISVHEERLKNKTWGQSMDPVFREMILGDDFVPISQLSGAFLRPSSPMQLQFAYFESSLAVDFWVETYGMPSLLRLLEDLAVGMPTEEALKRAAGTLELLDNDFREYALSKAQAYAPKVDFTRPKQPQTLLDNTEPVSSNSESYWNLREKCALLIRGKKFDEALVEAEKLKSIFPEDASADGVYALLATIYRSQGELALEREACITLVERTSDARDTLSRLIELDEKREDWESLDRWCEQLHEIQPLSADLQSMRAKVAERRNKPQTALDALVACLELNPTDRSDVHFRLATAFNSLGDKAKSKRHVLMALEESPRYVEALELFAALCENETQNSETTSNETEKSEDGSSKAKPTEEQSK